MAPSYTQDNRQIQLTTPVGKDALLLETFQGVEELSRLFTYELGVLVELSETITFDQLLGQSVTVAVTLGDGSSRYFNGKVATLVDAGDEFDAQGIVIFNRYVLRVVPTVWALTRSAQSKVFMQLSVVDILKKVFTGIDVDYSKLQGTYETRDHCFQYRETDFEFASRLMEEEGIFYFFKHANGSHTMVLGDSPQAHPVISDAFTYQRASAIPDPTIERVTYWEKSQTIQAGKVTLWDHHFELPDKNLAASQTVLESVAAGGVTQKLKVGGNDAYERYDYPGAYAKRFDGVPPGGGDQASQLQKVFDDNTRTVGIRMQQETVVGLMISGTGNCRNTATGSKFTLKSSPYNDDGAYVFTRVEFSASVEGSYMTGEAPSFDLTAKFQCIPFALPYRPERKTPQPRVAGAQTAVVVGPEGQEIFTDKYGRVKVQFFWDRLGQNDANSSCWVRVASPWAGKQWGMVHIPRIGHEVLVDFLEGDPDRPIIVGSVYNDANMPPYTLPDNATQSGIKSRSSLKGESTNFNELRFEDKKGSEEITFHAEKDFTRVVENNDALTVGSDDSETCPDGSQTISVYKDRTESVETGNESVTIKKGNRTVTVSEGNDKHEVTKGNRTVLVSQGDDSHEVTQGKRTVTVNMDDAHEIKTGNRSVKVDQGNDSLTVSLGNQSTTVSAGTSTTEAMQKITLKVGGNTIVIDPMSITLTVGGNSITINEMGVTVKGMTVSVQGEMTTEVKAGLQCQVNGGMMLMLKGAITMIN